MAKTNASFRLSKTTKRMMALMKGTAETRNQYKRMMIDAEHAASIVPKTSKGDRDNKRPQGTATYVTNDTGTASTQV
jgi:hypothetical protein